MGPPCQKHRAQGRKEIVLLVTMVGSFRSNVKLRGEDVDAGADSRANVERLCRAEDKCHVGDE